MTERARESWEEEFDKEFYEGVYGLAESDGEHYEQSDRVKAFIRYQLKKKRHTEEQEKPKLSLEEQYGYECSKTYRQATKACHLMGELAKRYLEEHHPGLEFSIEASVIRHSDADANVVLTDNFELGLDAVFPTLSIDESVNLLWEIEDHIRKYSMKYLPFERDIKVFVGKGKKEA